MKKRGPRAPNGASEVAVTLRMPEQMHTDAAAAAKGDGVTLTEWIRAAIRKRLERYRPAETT